MTEPAPAPIRSRFSSKGTAGRHRLLIDIPTGIVNSGFIAAESARRLLPRFQSGSEGKLCRFHDVAKCGIAPLALEVPLMRSEGHYEEHTESDSNRPVLHRPRQTSAGGCHPAVAENRQGVPGVPT